VQGIADPPSEQVMVDGFLTVYKQSGNAPTVAFSRANLVTA